MIFLVAKISCMYHPKTVERLTFTQHTPSFFNKKILLIFQKTKITFTLSNNNKNTNNIIAKTPSYTRHEKLKTQGKEVFLLCK